MTALSALIARHHSSTTDLPPLTDEESVALADLVRLESAYVWGSA